MWRSQRHHGYLDGHFIPSEMGKKLGNRQGSKHSRGLLLMRSARLRFCRQMRPSLGLLSAYSQLIKPAGQSPRRFLRCTSQASAASNPGAPLELVNQTSPHRPTLGQGSTISLLRIRGIWDLGVDSTDHSASDVRDLPRNGSVVRASVCLSGTLGSPKRSGLAHRDIRAARQA
jgi:hypothetical protein